MIHVSELGEKAGYITRETSGKSSDGHLTAMTMLPTADLFQQAKPRPTGGPTPSVDEFVQHKFYCPEGCAWCSQFRYDKSSRTVVRA